MPVTAPPSSPTAAANVPQAFLFTATRQPEDLAAVAVDESLSLTWAQLLERVRNLAAGLVGLGVKPGDAVGLMLKNRPEFMLADVAVMCLGGVPFSIYPTLPVAQILPILENAEARVVLCEQAFLPLIMGARGAGAPLEQVVVLEGGAEGCLDWPAVEAAGADMVFDLRARIESVASNALAAIVYTSGTTGPAKGVELTHAGVLKVVDNNMRYLALQPSHRYLSWLPTAGMAERVTSHYAPLVAGGTVYFCDDPRQAAQALIKARPHVFFAPPRFWEKMRAAIQGQWNMLTESDRQQIHAAVDQQLERVRLEQVGKPVPKSLAHACARSDAQLFAPLRERLGLGTPNVYACSGGAAAPRALLEFYYAIGLPLDEVYGQTESCALGTRSPRGRLRMGTVGQAQPGVELCLAEDGEILIRSAGVMRGYRKDPAATDAVLDAQGWLHTGDIGTVDADGYYRIVDRKKEMIINSFGKNMSPVNIEAALTMAGPFISQAAVVGDGRNYNVALLTVDPVHLQAWATREGLDALSGTSELLNHPTLLREVEAQVLLANELLSRVEQIKKFRIVGTEWMPGSPELTPTMKLKRRVINAKYADVIESMYQSEE